MQALQSIFAPAEDAHVSQRLWTFLSGLSKPILIQGGEKLGTQSKLLVISGLSVDTSPNSQAALSPHLREPDDEVVRHPHLIVHEIKSLRQLPLIGSQHLWDSGHHVLNLIPFKAEFKSVHLRWTEREEKHSGMWRLCPEHFCPES